jgi:hypothetical protein
MARRATEGDEKPVHGEDTTKIDQPVSAVDAARGPGSRFFNRAVMWAG